MALKGFIISASALSQKQKQEMYALMVQHFDNVFRSQFEKDLAAKDWVILLLDEVSGELKGFSTQSLFEHNYKDESLLIMFSGDTIIHPDFWGSFVLPITWGRLMLSIRSQYRNKKLYWMLISKGFRTYRFLPVFYYKFFPRYDQATPEWEDGLIHSLGKRKFPGQYDETSGIVRAATHSQCLKAGLVTVKETQRKKNPHIDFFIQTNPKFHCGDELVCIAPFDEANIKPYILRELNKEKFENLQMDVGAVSDLCC